MNLKVSMAVLNDHGISIGIENEDDDSITIYHNYKMKNHKHAINSAIAELNDVIDKLEALKLEEKPFHVATHDKINKDIV